MNISSKLFFVIKRNRDKSRSAFYKSHGVGAFEFVGSPLVNADGEDYEYNLYKTATSRYAQSPSAGYELLRFGRIINTEHETLVPADAPLWMTLNYPGGKGVVNLAVVTVKKFSDADFPHWTGWQLVDDDKDTYSQCNSATNAPPDPVTSPRIMVDWGAIIMLGLAG